MNIAERARLYREIRRALKSGGRFATFDVVSTDGEPHYLVPWVRTPKTSFLLTAAGTREAIERGRFPRAGMAGRHRGCSGLVSPVGRVAASRRRDGA
jgi:hypothetical protein